VGRARSIAIELPDAPNVLVIETGLVGELLVITPALRAIRTAYPAARITVAVTPGSAPVLVGNPNVDRLLALSKRERGGFLGLLRLASWIRAKRFDVALVLHTSFRSALAAAIGAVPVRAGLSSEGRGFLLTHKTPRDRAAYEVDEHLKVLELLGVPSAGRELELHLTEEERDAARSLLPGGADESPLVVLHPGASREIRRWPAERFAELGARLSSRAGAAVVFAFGPRERPLAERVELWFERERLSMPSTVFPENVRILGAVFERADAVVTNNTGPMHVAAAVGTGGVFIHGPTPVARWHPPGERFAAVFARGAPCRPCDSPSCRMDSLVCMESVAVDEVYAAVLELLGEAGAAEAAPRGSTWGAEPRGHPDPVESE
jgi:heptosyltransferase-2